MSNYGSVEITQKSPGEIEPEAETENATEEPQGESQEQQETGEESQDAQDRPEWLDDRFKSPEDLQKSYNELEAKLKERQNPKTDESTKASEAGEEGNEAPSTQTELGTLLNDANNDFWENGERLSDEMNKQLVDAGIPQQLIDTFAQNATAGRQAYVNEYQNVANGEYDQMTDWMQTTLDQQTLDTYNNAVNSGDTNLAKMAVQGVYSQYKAANGFEPNLMRGETSSAGGVKPFNSWVEVQEAMKDPRYKKHDKSYHESIDRRLAVSKL